MAGANRIEDGRAALAAWEASRPQNFFAADGNLQRVLQQHLGQAYATHEPVFLRTGQVAATSMDQLARLCHLDENQPLLQRYDSVGRAIERVIFPGAHDQLGALFWESGALQLLERAGGETVSGALIYLLDHQGETGHACPVACTAGLIKLLQRVGSPEQRERLLPGLCETDYSRRLYASQFVTEVQGGSDVGANDCRAVADADHPGLYRLSGEKWFCSVIDAPLFVVTARIPNATDGTSGLGLFLVAREREGKPNGFRIRRLKRKLGTRALASAEVDFDGALAEPIGPLDAGFKNLISVVLDTSRVHNALAASGAMRRALVEAHSFAQQRQAFGRPIIGFPAVLEILARMRVITEAAVATTFRLLALSDRLARGGGSAEEQLARRTMVNINKYWTAIESTRVVRDAIEVLGGNGTIEDFSVLPRLYRDTIVLESWEGTHNTLCAQVLRDFRARSLHQPWLAELRATLQTVAQPELQPHRQRAQALLDEVERRIEQMLQSDERTASGNIRRIVDRMCTLNAYVSLLLEWAWQHDQKIASDKDAIVELFRLRIVDRVEPLDHPEVSHLEQRIGATL